MSHSNMSRPETQQLDLVAPRSQTLDSGLSSTQGNQEESGPEVQDPLSHMSDIDKWGLKGFSLMMNNFPDYAALVTGTDMTNLGIDLNSTEYVSLPI
jgi:CCR4-NOT transcription complex subunit 2